MDLVSDFERGEIGPDLFRHACRMGVEGMVLEHRNRPYRAGRSPEPIRRRAPTVKRAFSSSMDRL
jgi:bifunctional non-homologous end joining protein LigD